MRFYKLFAVAAFLQLSLPTIAQHSYSIKSEADSAWARLQLGNYGPDFHSIQKAFLDYREEGLKFWKIFPYDPRRYEWLFKTVRKLGGYILYLDLDNHGVGFDSVLSGMTQPQYEYNLPLNKKKIQDWEKVYPQLKKEFLSYCNNNPKIGFGGNAPGSNQEIGLLVGELWSFLNLSLNKEYRPNQKLDLNKLSQLFKTITNLLDKEPDRNEKPNRRIRDRNEFYEIMNWAFISRYREFGLSVNDMNGFLNSIIKENLNGTAVKWAMQQRSLFALKEVPLSFKHISLHGDTIDLEKMRGKVLLVDFWSTSCSACIERMPAIKAVYDKYKTQGFEVISACLNNGDETVRIKAVEKKIAADWPILMIGGKTKEDRSNSLGMQIWTKYGFWGVPQLLLLNKEGKLVMLNDKLRNGDFEPEVKRLLAENYKSN